MIKLIITDIKYDLDGVKGKRALLKSLPKTLIHTMDMDYDDVMADKERGDDLQDIEDEVSDHISDTTNFCHTGFNYTIERG